jgi:uncharacterized protein (TIRG00374 family)
MNFNEIWNVIRRGVRYDIILFSLLFGLAANTVRAYRWGLLIETLNCRFKMKNLVYAVWGNYAINFVLPRVGEVWRCGIVSKYEKISFPKLFGTLVIDRMTDTLSVALITLFIFIFNFDFFKNFFARNPQLLIAFPDDYSVLWIFLACLILAGIVWFTFTYLNHLSLVKKTKGLLVNVWQGVKSIWLMERKGLFLLQTLVIWLFYFFFFYITFYAFDFTRHLGAGVGLVAFTMSSIAVAVPIQGGIGPWHFMVIATLICFGVKETDAAAFALVVHTVQSVWTALCGLFGIVALPLTNKENITA